MVKITVIANGPFVTEGVEVIDGEGRPIPTEPGKPVALCRCGASSQKPFCDGTHVKIGFKSEPTT